MTVNEESLYLGLLLGQRETSLSVWKTVTRLFFFFSPPPTTISFFLITLENFATAERQRWKVFVFLFSFSLFFVLVFPQSVSSPVAEQIDPGTVRRVFPCRAYYVNYGAFHPLLVSSFLTKQTGKTHSQIQRNIYINNKAVQGQDYSVQKRRYFFLIHLWCQAKWVHLRLKIRDCITMSFPGREHTLGCVCSQMNVSDAITTPSDGHLSVCRPFFIVPSLL